MTNEIGVLQIELTYLNVMQEPAHKIFVHKYLDWSKVQQRLLRYKNIEAQYKIENLKACTDKGPYYCHYLAWRLGAWETEELFELFDELLAHGSSICNWNKNKNLLSSCSFDDFWGLIWQLQVAKFFSSNTDAKIEWMRSGPDLKVISEDGIFFVECYTYRKSFGIEEFISELFYHISPKIKVNHISCIPFSLPKNSRTEPFLNEIFSHYLDPLFLENKIKEAEKEYPVLLPVPEKDTKNLYVYIEDSDPNHYIPGISPSSCGDPEEHLKIAIKEALDNKRNSNKLKDYHPNILAVNFLLGKDFQTAFSRQISLGGSIPSPNLGTTFDGVFFAACGINEVPSRERIFLQIKPDKDHPIMNIYGNDK